MSCRFTMYTLTTLKLQVTKDQLLQEVWGVKREKAVTNILHCTIKHMINLVNIIFIYALLTHSYRNKNHWWKPSIKRKPRLYSTISVSGYLW